MNNSIEMLQRTALMVVTILLSLAILLGACASEPPAPVEEPAEEAEEALDDADTLNSVKVS